MNKSTKIVILLISVLFFINGNCQVKMNFEFDIPYGNNQNVGKYALLNGAKIYYEEYGKGEPLLLIHGNGGSIKWMGNQIAYFKKRYRVIVADNRGHGKSELKTDSLTYKQITKDWEALVHYLKLEDSLNIIGWSDGGIIALKMGINNKVRIKKIVAMGANLRPDSTAVHSWAIKSVLEEKKWVELKIKNRDTTANWFLQKQLLGLLSNQPTIPVADLSQINAKVLIMAGDEDIIKGKHSVEIYRAIPKAQLCILPRETHFIPASNPKLFNDIADKFLSKPFQRPDSDWTKW